MMRIKILKYGIKLLKQWKQIIYWFLFLWSFSQEYW
jgi:hypothetical protein